MRPGDIFQQKFIGSSAACVRVCDILGEVLESWGGVKRKSRNRVHLVMVR